METCFKRLLRGGQMASAMAIMAIAAVMALGLPASAKASQPTQPNPTATLRILDKITARVEEMDVKTAAPFKFGNLVITVQACVSTLPEETPESAAFIDAEELKPGENGVPVFRGWTFASSPALSAIEHPVYDLWLIGCKQ